jgi:XTP/dITP diphosphohydrolase
LLPPRLLIATTNPGKLREIRRILLPEAVPPLACELASLEDFPALPEPEETGSTFAENALAKAREYARRTGWPTVAEDSGLAIEALGGRPGVESARYPGATYSDKFAHLYRELAPHPRPWRAKFVCSVAIVDPASDAVLFTGEAAVSGEIVPAPRGSHGFGYDPIFFYAPYGRTFGEVSDAEKTLVSHRGQAFRMVRDWLE